MKKIAIIIGTVYGGAQYVAEQVEEMLTNKGHAVALFDDPEINDITDPSIDILLAITSTTGEGDVPGNIETFYFELKDKGPLLNNKQYGVIGLGDSGYIDTFCYGGKKMDAILSELQAVKIGERLDIDACETMEPEVDALAWLEKWVTLF